MSDKQYEVNDQRALRHDRTTERSVAKLVELSLCGIQLGRARCVRRVSRIEGGEERDVRRRGVERDIRRKQVGCDVLQPRAMVTITAWAAVMTVMVVCVGSARQKF